MASRKSNAFAHKSSSNLLGNVCVFHTWPVSSLVTMYNKHPLTSAFCDETKLLLGKVE